MHPTHWRRCVRALVAASLALPAAPLCASPGTASVRAQVALESFEETLPFAPAHDSCEADVKAWHSSEDAHDGRSCAALSYVVRRGRGSVSLRGSLPLPGRVHALHLWVRGDASGRSLYALIVGADGTTRRLALGTLDVTGWRAFDAELAPAGRSDGAAPLEPPLRLTALVLDDVPAGSAGVVYFDALGVTADLAPEEQAPLTLSCADPFNLLSPQEQPVLSARGENRLQQPVSLNVFWEAMDYRGQRVTSGQFALHLGAGEHATREIKLPLTRPGFYRIEAAARQPGGSEQKVTLPLALLQGREEPAVPSFTDPWASAQSGGQAASRYGARSSYGGSASDDYGVDPETGSADGLGAAPEAAPAPPPSAVFPLRGCAWPDVERARGEYTFSIELDTWFEAMRQAGMRSFPITFTPPPLYQGSGAATSQAFAQYCRALARHWGGPKGIRVWELRHAAGAELGAPQSGDAADTPLRAAAQAIREADPEAIVAAGVDWETPADGLERALAGGAGRALDAVSLRAPPHVLAATPAGSRERLAALRQALARTEAKDKPLWLTGLTASPTADPEPTRPGEEAINVACACLDLMARGLIQAIRWSGLSVEPAPVDAAPAGAPWPEAAPSPTPALLAFHTVAQQLDGALFRADLSQGTIRAYRFESATDTLIALWSTGGVTAAALEINDPKPTAIGLMGEPADAVVQPGMLVLPLDAAPRFVRLRRAARVALRPVWIAPEEPAEAAAGTLLRVPLRFHNPFPAVGPGSLRLSAPPGWRATASVAPAPPGHSPSRSKGIEELTLSITPPAATEPGERTVSVGVDFPGAGLPTLSVEIPLRVLP